MVFHVFYDLIAKNNVEKRILKRETLPVVKMEAGAWNANHVFAKAIPHRIFALSLNVDSINLSIAEREQIEQHKSGAATMVKNGNFLRCTRSLLGSNLFDDVTNYVRWVVSIRACFRDKGMPRFGQIKVFIAGVLQRLEFRM